MQCHIPPHAALSAAVFRFPVPHNSSSGNCCFLCWNVKSKCVVWNGAGDEDDEDSVLWQIAHILKLLTLICIKRMFFLSLSHIINYFIYQSKIHLVCDAMWIQRHSNWQPLSVLSTPTTSFNISISYRIVILFLVCWYDMLRGWNAGKWYIAHSGTHMWAETSPCQVELENRIGPLFGLWFCDNHKKVVWYVVFVVPFRHMLIMISCKVLDLYFIYSIIFFKPFLVFCILWHGMVSG